MFKKYFLIFAVLLMAQTSFAINREDVNADFFEKFNDDCLNYYINSALNNNHNAKQASAVVEQYRQQVKYSLGSELPTFSVSANYLGIKVPKLDNFELKRNAFALPFTAGYEADLLLKNRDKTRAAGKNYEAAKFDEKGTYISLLTDVATVYTNILQYDELIDKQSKIVYVYQGILNSDNNKFIRGVINSSQLNDSNMNLKSAQNELENLIKEREILLMQLAILTGSSADDICNIKRGSLKNFEYSEKIPTQMDSDTIFSRPDVLAAEARLEKAKIDVRVARKDFLPTFNITGIWAFNTIAPGTFFSWESSLAAIIAGASQDIFAGGKKVANLKLQKAKYEELFENYRQTDLEAVKEVNTSLCMIKYDTDIENNTILKLNYETDKFNNIQKKFDRGTVSTPDYLGARSNLLTKEKEAAQAKTQRIVNYFTLYKATGGNL